MKDQRNSLVRIINHGFLSFLGTGYAPKAPGTVGSLATLPLIYALGYFEISFTTLCIITTIIFLLACWIADIVQKQEQVFDPGWIVIDEVVGMLVTWMFVFPKLDWINLLLVFGIFRVFDIVKIWPASFFDKKMKNGFATIFDDVVSAVYAGFFLLMLNYFHWIP